MSCQHLLGCLLSFCARLLLQSGDYFGACCSSLGSFLVVFCDVLSPLSEPLRDNGQPLAPSVRLHGACIPPLQVLAFAKRARLCRTHRQGLETNMQVELSLPFSTSPSPSLLVHPGTWTPMLTRVDTHHTSAHVDTHMNTKRLPCSAVAYLMPEWGNVSAPGIFLDPCPTGDLLGGALRGRT